MKKTKTYNNKSGKSFVYHGYTFQPLRNLTELESTSKNIAIRTNDGHHITTFKGYSYTHFYELAKRANANTDLFIMNSETVVIPNQQGFVKYDEAIRIDPYDTITYYTECCGKTIDKHSEDMKKGFTVKGNIPATGDTYCSRCKRDVTSKGRVKDTPRNTDINKNGSWDYQLSSCDK